MAGIAELERRVSPRTCLTCSALERKRRSVPCRFPVPGNANITEELLKGEKSSRGRGWCSRR